MDDKNSAINTFQRYVTAMLAPPCEPFTSPSLRTPVLKRIKRYFEDHKLKINNRPAGIGQSTQEKEIYDVKP